MPLSLEKLENLLNTNGFIPKKFFVINNLIIYMEILSIQNADSFMLYIPSKYDIQIGFRDDVYKIKEIEIDEYGNIPRDYGGEPDNIELEKSYDEIDLLTKPLDSSMEHNLEEKYKHHLSLKDISKDVTEQLREIFRQLRRLKFCVQNLKYKLCIIFKNYVCCIGRRNTFDCYSIENIQGSSDKKLLISLDLETLYTNFASITVDINTIREGVYRVLDKNNNKHINNISKMLEQKNDLNQLSDIIIKKKTHYSNHLKSLEKLLYTLIQSEKKIVEKLIDIQERYSCEASIKGLHVDIEQSHQTSKLEDELSRINVVKQELISNILQVKTKYDNLSLKVDNICFDNIIMIDAILKNFVLLKEL